MAAIGKKFGQLKQWTGERIAGAQKTELSQEFRQLEIETDARIEFMGRMHGALEAYLRSLSTPKDIPLFKGKKTPCEAMAVAMLSYAQRVPSQTPYARALIALGDAYDRVGLQQAQLAQAGRDNLLLSLQGATDDVKDFEAAKSKMERRRLDLDAKLNRIYKAKKEKPELEDETRTAQAKYEESLTDISRRMEALAAREHTHLEDLLILMDAQVACYSECLRVVEAARAQLTDLPRNPHLRSASRLSAVNPSSSRPVSGSPMPARPFVSSDSFENQDAPSASLFTAKPPAMAGSRSHPNISLVASTPVHGTSPPSAPAGPVGYRARCLFDFTAESPAELSLRKGDVVVVTAVVSDGWWQGSQIQSGEQGMFPSNYCELVGPDETQATSSYTRSPSAGPSVSPSLSFSGVDGMGSSSSGIAHTSNGNLAPPITNGGGGGGARSSSTSRSRSVSPVPPSPASRRSMIGSSAGSSATASRGTSPPPPPRSRGLSETNGADQGLAPSNPFVRSHSGNALSAAVTAAVAQQQNGSGGDGGGGTMPKCGECGCTEYVAHAFKRGQCNNCYHAH